MPTFDISKKFTAMPTESDILEFAAEFKIPSDAWCRLEYIVDMDLYELKIEWEEEIPDEL